MTNGVRPDSVDYQHVDPRHCSDPSTWARIRHSGGLVNVRTGQGSGRGAFCAWGIAIIATSSVSSSPFVRRVQVCFLNNSIMGKVIDRVDVVVDNVAHLSVSVRTRRGRRSAGRIKKVVATHPRLTLGVPRCWR